MLHDFHQPDSLFPQFPKGSLGLPQQFLFPDLPNQQRLLPGQPIPPLPRMVPGSCRGLHTHSRHGLFQPALLLPAVLPLFCQRFPLPTSLLIGQNLPVLLLTALKLSLQLFQFPVLPLIDAAQLFQVLIPHPPQLFQAFLYGIVLWVLGGKQFL